MFSRFTSMMTAAIAVGAMISSTASAATLGIADNYNAVIFGNFSATGGDTEGRLAVGGNATMQWYSVGHTLSNSHGTRDDLIVGGNLHTPGQWQVSNGNAVYGGTLGTAPTTPNGSTRKQANVIDFNDLKSELSAASLFWGSLASTASAQYQWSTLTLTGSDAAMNIFNVTEAQWESASNRVISAPTGSTVLINIAGVNVSMSGGLQLQGVGNVNVLYNFYEATNLSVQSIAMLGSVLAPKAHLNLQSGNINGITVVNSATTWNGGEFHNYGFAGDLPDAFVSVIPEPSTAGLMLVMSGVALLRGGRRRG